MCTTILTNFFINYSITTGSCIGVVFSIRISEYAMLTIWLILRLVELFNIIFEVIIGVIVYSYISTTEGYVVLGFSTLHSFCEIYGWSITKSMYLKDSLSNNIHNQEKAWFTHKHDRSLKLEQWWIIEFLGITKVAIWERYTNT